ncbi:MAG: nucleotidyltransferase family protein [Candidatus Omnitrophica bacterium]|nr:nucleotidyltransferase family protein [Candidatus Omnitrophota bacterium]
MKEKLFTLKENLLLNFITSDEKPALTHPKPDQLWEAVIEYDLSCLFYCRFKDRLLTLFNENKIHKLKNRYLTALAVYHSQKQRTLEIISKFKTAGITAIPLKGVFLNDLIYSQEAARGISKDIDILVKRNDYSQSAELLEKSGYKTGNIHLLIEEGESFTQAHFGSAEKFSVDLGFGLSVDKPFPELEEKNYWKNPFFLKTENERIQLLNKEMTFIHLCLLIIKERNSPAKRLSYFIDLHFFLIRFQAELDYNLLAATLKENDLQGYASIIIKALEKSLSIKYSFNRGRSIKFFLDQIALPQWRERILTFALLKSWQLRSTSVFTNTFFTALALSRGRFIKTVPNIFAWINHKHIAYIKQKKTPKSILSWLRHFKEIALKKPKKIKKYKFSKK